MLIHLCHLCVTFAGVPTFYFHLMLVEIWLVSSIAICLILEMGVSLIDHEIIDRGLQSCT